MADQYIKDVLDEVAQGSRFEKGMFGTMADNYEVGKTRIMSVPDDPSQFDRVMRTYEDLEKSKWQD